MQPDPLTSEVIKRIRGDQTQVQFAAAVGCSGAPLVSRWEHGSRPGRYYRVTLLRLARQRGVKLAVAS